MGNPSDYTEYTAAQATKYHEWYASEQGRALGREQREALQRAAGRERGQLIEAGCGTGYFTAWFHELGFRVTAIDMSPAMISLAARHAPHGVRLCLASAGQLPFSDHSFDAAAFVTSLEFIRNPKAAVGEAFRVARNKMIFLLLNPDHPMNAKRIQKAAVQRGVFGRAKFWRPGEMKELVRESARPGAHIEIKVSGFSEQQSYYLLTAVWPRSGTS
jgi:ubiquinone/menaquinone biosynthesis C-methylase UbiE